MSKKICLISDLHLSSNPRTWKEASTLAAAGYEVVILTIWTSSEKREKDLLLIQGKNIIYKASLNLIPGEIRFLKRFYIRLRRRLARDLKRILNIESSWCIGYAPQIMTEAALNEKADLYIAHTEFGILVGKELIRKGVKLAYDIEDWYSHDYLVPERPVALFKSLENFALENSVYCSCPSESMATALEKTYSSGKKAHVLYNGFSEKENAAEVVAASNGSSLVWFSQTIGPGRGLETILKALHVLETKIELHLIGACVAGYDAELNRIFPFNKGHQLIIHPAVKHHELVSILAQHNIGLAIENNTPENKNRTVSNKILQYLQAGIKVLATDTEGQKEVAAFFPDTVTTVPVDHPELWAKQIDILLQSAPVNRRTQLQQFNEQFSWEAQEKKLLELVKKAISA
ncbi:MAG: glycosyltransferase [Chitinophagaceae bacterium]|nr:glycosyltransferase [Chitinophagaceae bacterium]